MKLISQKCGICLNFYSTRFRDHCPLCGAYKIVENGRVKWFTWHTRWNQFIPIARVFPFPIHGLLDRVIAKAIKIREKERKEELKAERKHGLQKLQTERKQRKDTIENAKANGEVFIR